MLQEIYVIMEDRFEDLGEGYSSNSWDIFVGATTSFETARNVIEYLADQCIGETNPGYQACKNCGKSYCGDCEYHYHMTVTDDDWDMIDLEPEDSFRPSIRFHFAKVKI